MPAINIIAVILATLSTMVVGAVWYTPKVFDDYWMRVARIDRESQGSAVGPILVTLLVSFVSALVLAVATTVSFAFFGGSFLVVALVTGIVL